MFQVVQFLNKVAGNRIPLLVAHNSKFDVRMIGQEAERFGHHKVTIPTTWRFACSIVDAAKIAWPTEASYSMKSLSAKIGADSKVAHRALDDVIMQANILQHAAKVRTLPAPVFVHCACEKGHRLDEETGDLCC